MTVKPGRLNIPGNHLSNNVPRWCVHCAIFHGLYHTSAPVTFWCTVLFPSFIGGEAHRLASLMWSVPFFFRLLPHTRILSWSFSLKTGRFALKLFQQKPGGKREWVKRKVGVGCSIWRMICACCFFLERDLKSPSASVCWAERASSPSNNFLNPVSSKIRCTNLGWKCSHVCWATM